MVLCELVSVDVDNVETIEPVVLVYVEDLGG
jgi:hypothetical protein